MSESSRTLEEATGGFLRASTRDELRRVLLACPALLTEVAADSIESRLRQADNESRLAVAESLRVRWKLLRRCREIGIDAAFDELPPPTWAADVSDELREVFERLLRPHSPEEMFERVRLVEHGLELLPPDGNPLRRAGLYFALGRANFSLPGKDFADGVERAIAAYREAASIYATEKASGPWASTMHNLGIAYYRRIQGSKADNLETALQTLRDALAVRLDLDNPWDQANTWYHIGLILSERVRGNRPTNLEDAAQALREAIRLWEDAPLDRAMAQNVLGNVYLLTETGDRAAKLEDAKSLLESALLVRTRESHPVAWANSTHNLANVYRARIEGDKRTNISEAVSLFKAALEVFDHDTHGLDWAYACNDLAGTLVESPIGDRANNIEQALAYIQPTLELYRDAGVPAAWAKAQLDLGNAYLERQRGDLAQNVEIARFAISCALQVFTRDQFPADHAHCLATLGVAYLRRAIGSVEENTEQAVAAMEAAFSILSADTRPEIWAAAHTNLGNAYLSRRRGDRSTNIELAIKSYAAAKTVFSLEAYPYYWGTLTNNLGSAFLHRRQGNRSANIWLARSEFLDSLTVFSKDEYPEDWARSQGNLGAALLERPDADRVADFRGAIRAIEAALEVYSPWTHPQDWARNRKNLGTAYHEAGNRQEADRHWQEALNHWQGALAWTVGGDSPARSASEIVRIRVRVFAAHGQHTEALVALEAGKAIRIRLELARTEASPAGLTESERREFVSLTARVQALASEHRAILRRGDRPLETQTQLSRLNESSRAAYDRLRELLEQDRELPVSTPSYAELRLLAREHNLALVYLHCPSEEESPVQGWIVHPNSPEDRLSDADCMAFPEINRAYLRRLLRGDSDRLPGLSDVGEWLRAFEPGETPGWDEAYRLLEVSATTPYGSQCQALWHAVVSKVLDDLGRRLATPLADRLRGLDARHIVLLPDNLLAPFPIHAMSVGAPVDAGCFGDRFAVSYAPSAVTLAKSFEHLRDARTRSPRLAAISNPDGSLPFANFEIEMVTRCFPGRAAVATGFEAARDWLQSHVDTEFLVLATHAQYNRSDPAESYLLLARRAGGPDSPGNTSSEPAGSPFRECERLSLDELWAGRLRLRPGCVVTANACETGQIDPELDHEESPGFPAAFLAAGASTVLASLWRVDDLASALLIARVHELMAGRPTAEAQGPVGHCAAEALREAQAWLRGLSVSEVAAFAEQARLAPGTRGNATLLRVHRYYRETARTASESKPFSHPFYWAGFACWGVGCKRYREPELTQDCDHAGNRPGKEDV